jgi:hypothetical protein
MVQMSDRYLSPLRVADLAERLGGVERWAAVVRESLSSITAAGLPVDAVAAQDLVDMLAEKARRTAALVGQWRGQ